MLALVGEMLYPKQNRRLRLLSNNLNISSKVTLAGHRTSQRFIQNFPSLIRLPSKLRSAFFFCLAVGSEYDKTTKHILSITLDPI